MLSWIFNIQLIYFGLESLLEFLAEDWTCEWKTVKQHNTHSGVSGRYSSCVCLGGSVCLTWWLKLCLSHSYENDVECRCVFISSTLNAEHWSDQETWTWTDTRKFSSTRTKLLWSFPTDLLKVRGRTQLCPQEELRHQAELYGAWNCPEVCLWFPLAVECDDVITQRAVASADVRPGFEKWRCGSLRNYKTGSNSCMKRRQVNKRKCRLT